MADCPTCGNPVDAGNDLCPFCEQPLEYTAEKSGSATINLKEGQPVVDVARARLDAAIANHRLQGTAVLVIIHGYGASGVGGGIKTMVRAQLETLKYQRQIDDFIPGEDLRRVSRNRLPKAFRPSNSDIGNRGITIVVM